MAAVAHIQPSVLVVEDNADDVCLFKAAIRRAPISVAFHFVSDGEEAISYLKGEPPFSDRRANPFPDLVLLDLTLPKVDGFTVLEWIRTTPGCESLRVFVWSGWQTASHLERAKKLRAERFILKVAGVEGLADVVTAIGTALKERATESGSAV